MADSPGSIHPLYLASKGNANSISGAGKLTWQPNRDDKPDQYDYDPRFSHSDHRGRDLLFA